MGETAASPEGPVFAERPTEFIVRDAFLLGILPLALAGVAGALGAFWIGASLLGATVFVAVFFRNPPRLVEGDERSVVAPADGRVLEAGEIELPDGSKAKRVGIFLSVFDVHVNRAPIAGRVVSIERGGQSFLAAFNRRAETENARCTLTLETGRGERVRVVQITGLIARRIVCYAREGDDLPRGLAYGLICYGSRVELYLPASADVRVRVGDRVKGGASVIAEVSA